MSPSQRQAMITLTKKQDKDRTCLENRRPIPLTNVDVKIASKIIATLSRKSYPKSFIAIRRSLVPLFQSKSIVRNHSDENDFDLHENETACRTHFRMKGFAVEFETEAQDTRKWTHLLRLRSLHRRRCNIYSGYKQEYTKTYDILGLLLFIDFKKAFDSLEWKFMFKCLEIFGFGSSLTRWVQWQIQTLS